jgi:FkbM family methyltransferase
MITEGEFAFFEKIKDNCSVIFDVGCKEDIHYITSSKNKTFHYFEPNIEHYIVCKEKIKNDSGNNIIYLNNFGLSNRNDVIKYWADSESFFKRHFHYQSRVEPSFLTIKKFSNYINESNITNIDFLKIDTEGCEPDILLDNPNFIKSNVKYVQFEWASTWVDRDDGIIFTDIYNEFTEFFDFYFLYNSAHPISATYTDLLTLIDNDEMINLVNNYVMNAYGFEIVMIKR